MASTIGYQSCRPTLAQNQAWADSGWPARYIAGVIGYLSRILPVALREQRRPPTGALSTRTDHRVSLSQVDFNRHMNQAAYPQVCELARVPWLFRSGAWQRWRDGGINPVVASQAISYRRELAPLQRYQVDTRAVGLDGRLLQLQQLFLVGDRVHARNDVSLIFVGPEGVLSPEDAAAQCAGLTTEALAVDNWTIGA